jgi:hypothetical protein
LLASLAGVISGGQDFASAFIFFLSTTPFGLFYSYRDYSNVMLITNIPFGGAPGFGKGKGHQLGGLVLGV